MVVKDDSILLTRAYPYPGRSRKVPSTINFEKLINCVLPGTILALNGFLFDNIFISEDLPTLDPMNAKLKKFAAWTSANPRENSHRKTLYFG